MPDQICSLCGIRFIDGTYRFSYRPAIPVHPDAVFTRICKSAIDAQSKRDTEREIDLKPISLDLCINKAGQYNKKYRWLKPNEVV